MKHRIKYLFVISTLIALCNLPQSAFSDILPSALSTRILQWFKGRQKLAHLTVGTVEEIGENKLLISTDHIKPKPGDELIIYSYSPTLDTSLYPEVAVVKVETIKWNELQARIVIEEDISVKKGDIAKYPSVGAIFLQCTDEYRNSPEYLEILRELLRGGFTVVEYGNFSDFPYGYIVNLDISGKIETIRIISIFDGHLFYIDSCTVN